MFSILFLYVFEIQCIFYIYSTFQFHLATFQKLNTYMTSGYSTRQCSSLTTSLSFTEGFTPASITQSPTQDPGLYFLTPYYSPPLTTHSHGHTLDLFTESSPPPKSLIHTLHSPTTNFYFYLLKYLYCNNSTS